MTVKVNAASRLVMASDADNIVADLKKVGFKNIFKDGIGHYTMDEMPADKVKSLCDKLLKMGYDVQGKNLYPGDDGMFYMHRGEMNVAVDPEGYVYIELN